MSVCVTDSTSTCPADRTPASTDPAGLAAMTPSLSERLRLAASRGHVTECAELLAAGAAFEPDQVRWAQVCRPR